MGSFGEKNQRKIRREVEHWKKRKKAKEGENLQVVTPLRHLVSEEKGGVGELSRRWEPIPQDWKDHGEDEDELNTKQNEEEEEELGNQEAGNEELMMMRQEEEQSQLASQEVCPNEGWESE